MLSTQDWSLGVGEIATEIDAYLNEQPDDPDAPYAAPTLYRAGLICGGSQYLGDEPNRYYFAEPFAMDTNGALVPTGDPDDPYERMSCDGVLANLASDGLPPGIYKVSSLGYWNANYVLGLQ